MGPRRSHREPKQSATKKKKVENLALTFYNDHLFAEELLIPFTLS